MVRENPGVTVAHHLGAGWAGTKVSGEEVPAGSKNEKGPMPALRWRL